MSRAGQALRQSWRLDALGKAPCGGCGHPTDAHRELGSTWEIVGGEAVEVVHPEHVPGHFHCTHDGCVCVMDMTA